MLAAEEIQEALDLSSGWFLENLWLVALIPAIGFALIMGFGKKMPNGGSEFGLASMAASLVIATGAGPALGAARSLRRGTRVARGRATRRGTAATGTGWASG